MKDAYYFSHDSNARNDQRIIKLRRKLGAEGYGIYFMLIEILRDQVGYRLGLDDDILENISYDLRVDMEKVEDIVLNYELFHIDRSEGLPGNFYSVSLKRRMEKMDLLKQKRMLAGQKGGIASANVKQTLSKAQPLDYTILNKTKPNKIKERNILFKKQVFEFSEQFDKSLLNEFYDYWSESNKSNTKMRYEQEKTWDLSRRIKRWANNNFSKNKTNGKGSYKLDSSGFPMAYCEKCGISESYRFEELNGDSRCCNSKLLPEKPVAVR